MSRGKVKQYNSQQGYGSIIDSDSGRTLTVYANYIHLQEGAILKGGQEVEYDIECQRNENWAVNVRAL
ncbi:MAG: cold shock domain-containing protein [Candidatus Omnitrophota bacterium]